MHTKSGQIPCLGSCALLTNWEKNPDQFGKIRYFFQIYTGSFGFGFKLIMLFFRKYKFYSQTGRY